MNRRQLLRLVLLASAITIPRMARADESTVSIVTLFYKLSAGKDGKYSGKSAYYQDKIRAKYFTKSLRDLVVALEKKAKQKDDPGLDFDPVTNSQDPSVKDLKIEQDGESDGESAVNASFATESGSDRMVIRYIFLRQQDAWKLDNITTGTGGEGWDLRKLIKGILDEYNK